MTDVNDAVRINRHYKDVLGWTAGEVFAEAVAEADVCNPGPISALQEELKLKVDGLLGPGTYSAVLQRNQNVWLQHMRELDQSVAVPRIRNEERLELAGKVALAEAKICWLLNISDLPASGTERARCAFFIDQLIRTPLGIDWYWEEPYKANGQYEWCGTLPARGWGRAGIKLALRRRFFSSNYRLDRFARYQSIDDKPAEVKPTTPGPHRMIIELNPSSTVDKVRFPDGTRPRSGDIMLIGPERLKAKPAPAYGMHVTMIDSFDPSSEWVHTVEGNGTGTGPKGNTQHGMVRAQRRIGLGTGMDAEDYIARRILRPGIEDLA